MDLIQIPPGCYRHHSGDLVEVIATAFNKSSGASNEQLVVYRNPRTGTVFALEAHEFIGLVEVESVRVPRFEFFSAVDQVAQGRAIATNEEDGVFLRDLIKNELQRRFQGPRVTVHRLQTESDRAAWEATVGGQPLARAEAMTRSYAPVDPSGDSLRTLATFCGIRLRGDDR